MTTCRLKLAANNAAIYGVSHAIDFVQGDTLASFKRMALLTRNGSFEDEYHMIFFRPLGVVLSIFLYKILISSCFCLRKELCGAASAGVGDN